MISKVEQDIINRRLLSRMGLELDGRPKFRLSWSTDQLEKRLGTWPEFSESGKIFLRMFTGCKEIRKYPQAKDRWVLERLVFDPTLELVGSRSGSYEPIYVFQGANGDYLEPTWKIIEILIYFWENPNPKKTLPDMIREEEAFDQQEVEFFANVLADEGRSNLFAFENSAFISATNQKFWDRSSK